ncbi:MAG: T9SS type A sorting domain-containing protein [Flavobacterium sp.]|nr:MAG: T9SS type A sorting domain-containing protein [Flavobacterium sp.]
MLCRKPSLLICLFLMLPLIVLLQWLFMAINLKAKTMKAKLLLLLLAFTAGVSAQTTHHINWFPGVPASETNITVAPGDTVMWMWTSPHPHSVTSGTGSAETFDSGVITGTGKSFSHVFNTVGINPYVCVVHANMAGTVTVQTVMGIEENKDVSFEYYPNPVTDVLTISARENITSIKMFDLNGRLILEAAGGNPVSKIYMANYNAGTYLVQVTAGGATKSISVVKK